MDHSQAPLLEALEDYRRRDRYGFTPPAHRQGRATDPSVLKTLGAASFKSDLLAASGLDDRRSSNKYLQRAEQLMADAVGADQAFYDAYPKDADPDTSKPYVMWAGTPYRHLMVPVN